MTPSNKSLFAIQSDLQLIFDELEEAGGEITPELTQQLAISREELKVKSVNYVHFIKKLENDLELAAVYEQQLSTFKKRKQRAIDNLKESLLNAVKNFGDIEAEVFTIKTRKSEQVQVFDIDKLPVEFMAKKVTFSPDKAKIKELIKAGQEVPGAEIVQNVNLAIK